MTIAIQQEAKPDVGTVPVPTAEEFWQDYLTLGDLFGVDRATAPADHAAFRAYMRERLASDDLHVTPRAREIATFVAFELPMPAHRLPALAVINHAIVGTLPRRAREEYGLPWSRVDEARLVALTGALRAGAIVLPRGLWTGCKIAVILSAVVLLTGTQVVIESLSESLFSRRPKATS